jgi:hypothetical protein
MMDRLGRYGVIMLFPAVLVGLRVTRVKSPMYGKMALGAGNSLGIPFKASTRRLKT